MVTIPMVRMPMFLATPAMMGAAPVPVPPPIPAVTNTIFVPSFSNLRICSMLSSAAFLPTDGFAPAPNPVSPKGIFMGTGELANDFESVLQTANVTLSIPSLYMFLTALQPPPPTPITLMMSRERSSIGPKSTNGRASLISNSSILSKLRNSKTHKLKNSLAQRYKNKRFDSIFCKACKDISRKIVSLQKQ